MFGRKETPAPAKPAPSMVKLTPDIVVDADFIFKAKGLEDPNPSVRSNSETYFENVSRDKGDALVVLCARAKTDYARNVLLRAASRTLQGYKPALIKLIATSPDPSIVSVAEAVFVDEKNTLKNIENVKGLASQRNEQCISIALSVCENNMHIVPECLSSLLSSFGVSRSSDTRIMSLLSDVKVGATGVKYMMDTVRGSRGITREADKTLAAIIRNSGSVLVEADLIELASAGNDTAFAAMDAMDSCQFLGGLAALRGSSDKEISMRAKMLIMKKSTSDMDIIGGCIGKDKDLNTWCLNQLEPISKNVNAKYLLLKMIDGADEVSSAKAASVLLKSPPVPDMKFLYAASKSDNVDVARWAVDIMGKILRSEKNTPQVRKIAGDTLILTVANTKPDVAKHAIRTFLALKNPETVLLFQKYLEDSNKTVRTMMMKAFGDAPPDAVITQALSTDHDDVRAWALYRYDGGLDKPASMFKGGEPSVRAAVICKFGRALLDSEAHRHVVSNACADPDPKVRAAAVRIIGEAGFAAGSQSVASLLDDPDASVRMEAVTASRHVPCDRGAILKTLSDPDPKVRAAAVRTSIGVEEAIPIIEAMLSDPDDFVVFAVLTALGIMGYSVPLSKMGEFLSHNNPMVRAGAVRALGLTGEHYEEAVALMADQNPNVQRWTAWTLSRSISPSYVDDLFQYLPSLSPDEDCAPLSDEALCESAAIEDAVLLRCICQYLGRIGDRCVANALRGMLDTAGDLFGSIVRSSMPDGYLESKGQVTLGLALPDPIDLNVFADIHGVILSNPNPFPVTVHRVWSDGAGFFSATSKDSVTMSSGSKAEVDMNIMSSKAGNIPVSLMFSLEYLGIREDQRINLYVKITDKDDAVAAVRSRTLVGLNKPWTDRYERVGEIGSGGTATVLKVLEKETGRVFALKSPKIMVDDDESVVISQDVTDSFLSEMKTWMEVTERAPKFVVNIVDKGKIPIAWIVMEYATETLADRMSRGMSADQAADIGCDILDALDYIHDAGISHLDIKPGNILLVDGKWKLSDFGLSNTTVGANSSVRGTLAYFSPEQVRGENLTTATDVWQAAILIYQMMTGRLPYPEPCTTLDVTSDNVLNKKPCLDGIPEEYASVLAGAFSEFPTERPSAKDLRVDLHDAHRRRRSGGE